MKTKLATCFILGTLLVSSVALAEDSDSDRAHPVAFVKDSAITTKIKAKLAVEKIKTLAQVRVDTDAKGAVVLSGFVRNQEQQDRAVAIASNTEGVTSVKNNLRIKKDD
ncbi:MAG: BON domain-containing protein [Burkholderiaceae bacterium]